MPEVIPEDIRKEIESLQLARILDDSVIPSDIDRIMVLHDDQVAAAEGKLKSLPLVSALQDPVAYLIIKEAEGHIREFLPDAQHIVPILASAPNGGWNAHCFKRADRYIIILDERALEYAHVVSQPTAQLFLDGCSDVFHSTEVDAPEEIIIPALNRDRKALSDVLQLNVAFRLPPYKKWYELLQGRDLSLRSTLAVVIRHAFLYYLIAHEYGHMLWGHLDDQRVEDPANRFDASYLTYDQEMETIADMWAVTIALKATTRSCDNFVLACMGIELMLLNIGLQGVVGRILDDREPYLSRLANLTHPYQETRRMYMKDALEEYLQDKTIDEVKRLRLWIDRLYSICASNFERSLPEAWNFATIDELKAWYRARGQRHEVEPFDSPDDGTSPSN